MPRPEHAAAEPAILALLRERPRHGYDVARALRDPAGLGAVLTVETSAVYALLKELEEEGLVEGHVERVGARPPRTVYVLTPSGERAVDDWLATPVRRMREVRLDFLCKLYFAERIGGRAVGRLVDAQAAECEAYAVRVRRAAENAAPGSYLAGVWESKRTAAEATLAWLRGLARRD